MGPEDLLSQSYLSLDMDVIYTVLTLILALSILYIYNALSASNNSSKNFPPGPKPLPVIGNLHIMNLKKPYLTLMELSKTYGSVFSIQLGMKKMVVLTGYETVKNALVNHTEDFGERAKVPIFEKIDQGMGLILSHGDNWKAMRRFTITTLRDFGMGKRTIEENIIEECDELVKHFESFKGKAFDNSMILNAAVANIIIAVALGYRMDYNDPTLLRLLSLTNENIRLIGSPMVSLYNIFPGLWFLPGGHKTVLNNIEEIHDFIRTTFINCLKDLDANDQRSFIDAFLARQKEEEGNSNSYFHNKNLTSLVRNLFSAGMETTTTTIRWGLLYMIKYPDIQEKVQEEIARVVGSAQPNYDHRVQMPFTYAVIHEIQRFANILPMNLPHETTKDVTFKGYFIPKGTYIIPLLASVLYDKTQFNQPDIFNPQHFLDSDGNFMKKDAFMPFSSGRRACAGENLARMELFLFFTTLLQKFTFQKAPGVIDIDITPAVGLVTPPLPYKICAISRY
ncbi:cytochrome P450 2K1-like [Discoglossus pictus]